MPRLWQRSRADEHCACRIFDGPCVRWAASGFLRLLGLGLPDLISIFLGHIWDDCWKTDYYKLFELNLVSVSSTRYIDLFFITFFFNEITFFKVMRWKMMRSRTLGSIIFLKVFSDYLEKTFKRPQWCQNTQSTIQCCGRTRVWIDVAHIISYKSLM